MIVAPQPEAVEAGAGVLAAGGNAIDATIACALTQGVVDPLMCGVGGLGVMQVWDSRTGRHEIIDGLSRAPARLRPRCGPAISRASAPTAMATWCAAPSTSSATPPSPRPASCACSRLRMATTGVCPGRTCSRRRSLRARQGWIVRPHVYAMFTADEAPMAGGRSATSWTSRRRARALYMEDGAPKRLGRPVRNPALAETLATIAAGGADAFYAGAIAQVIADDMAAHGGLMSWPTSPASGAVRQRADDGAVPRPDRGAAAAAGRRDRGGRDPAHRRALRPGRRSAITAPNTSGSWRRR